MKSSFFLIFIAIVTVVYAFSHYYLYQRTIQLFAPPPSFKKWIAISYVILASFFIGGMFLEKLYPSLLSEWIYKIGTAYLPFLLYFLLVLLSIDLIRILNHFFHFLPLFSQHQKTLFGISAIVLVCVIVCIGHINAKHIRITRIPLTIHKTVNDNKNIKLLMASDIHLGAIIGESWEKKFLGIVEKEKPDLVLLCGDLIDGEVAPVLRQQLGKHIQEINPPLGLYAVSGNHEYIGNIETALSYLESIHIKVLQDEVLMLPNGIQLVGCKDIQSKYADPENPAKPLETLLENIDNTKPVIVMKHQPLALDEAADAGVDLHLSGHTHSGQLWPLNYITKAIYELSWGYMKKKNTHFYVTSGFGTWGPSVRLGNYPEVVVFTITFNTIN